MKSQYLNQWFAESSSNHFKMQINRDDCVISSTVKAEFRMRLPSVFFYFFVLNNIYWGNDFSQLNYTRNYLIA